MHSNEVTVDDRATNNKALDEGKAMATMLHEMGHVLGIGHSKETDSCMKESIDPEIKSVGDSDKRELKSACLDWNSTIHATVAAVPGGTRYTVEAHWLSGGEGALVQRVTGDAPITDIALPPGWERYDYGSPSDILTFLLDPTDALQAYLNATNSTETFAFTSPVAPSLIGGWAGTDQMLLGPYVPEPSSVGVTISALLLIARRRR